jgi:glycine hydroxymethyltransferase
VVTGGTDNHIILWDARPLGISGAQLERVLDAVEVSTNKNTLYGDTSALNPGGVRIGTCAVTTRGMCGEEHMASIATMLDKAAQLAVSVNEQALAEGREKGEGLTQSGRVSVAAFDRALEEPGRCAEIALLRRDVEAFASAFPLPGLSPVEE